MLVLLANHSAIGTVIDTEDSAVNLGALKIAGVFTDLAILQRMEVTSALSGALAKNEVTLVSLLAHDFLLKQWVVVVNVEEL